MKKQKKITKEFFFKGDSFVGELLDDHQTYRIWQKVSGDKWFVTTGLPSPDQLIVFKKLDQEFVFFTRFQVDGDVWKVGDQKMISHYTPLSPYQAKALVVPYKVDIEGVLGFSRKIIVEFFDSFRLKNRWKFQEQDGSSWMHSHLQIDN
jgi:hypothetical protein